MTGTTTAGDAVAHLLRRLGVVRTFGIQLGELAVVPCEDPDVAVLLADCEGRLNGAFGAAMLDEAILHISSQPGGTANPLLVESISELAPHCAALGYETVPSTAAFFLDFDLDAPLTEADQLAMREPPPVPEVIARLDESFADLNVVVIVGSGVVRSEAQDVLAKFCAQSGHGVFNTWGAKGIFRWDDPRHLGTIGLQSQDFALAGAHEADLVITSGVDQFEASPDLIGSYVIHDSPPDHLAAMVATWSPRESGQHPLERGFYDTMAGLLRPLYEMSSGPVNPARAALQLSGASPHGGVVCCDAGRAGFWVARAYPTGIVDSVLVPARREPGTAVAGALVATLQGRPALAVLDEDLDERGIEMTQRVIETARSLGANLSIQSWGEGVTTPDEHVEMCTHAFAGGPEQWHHVGLDHSAFESLVDLAGPVVAWGGIEVESESRDPGLFDSELFDSGSLDRGLFDSELFD